MSTMISPVGRLAELFASEGAGDYLGEPVTVAQLVGLLARFGGLNLCVVEFVLSHTGTSGIQLVYPASYPPVGPVVHGSDRKDAERKPRNYRGFVGVLWSCAEGRGGPNGARSRNRTGTELPPRDFKSLASTNFAIRAAGVPTGRDSTSGMAISH